MPSSLANTLWLEYESLQEALRKGEEGYGLVMSAVRNLECQLRNQKDELKADALDDLKIIVALIYATVRVEVMILVPAAIKEAAGHLLEFIERRTFASHIFRRSLSREVVLF